MATTGLDLIAAALDAFDAKVRAVTDWTAPTPCTAWTVRDLMNHLTSEHLWAPHLLRGETLAEVGDRYDGDVLGDDPAAAWARAVEGSRAAWPDADPYGRVHLSSGLASMTEYAEQMCCDLVVHGWDLARAAGLDSHIDPAVAEHFIAVFGPQAGKWPDYFADPVPTDSTDPGDRLVALLGRDPHWSPPTEDD
jgi:uncharacterized protein (TIGR03086 family)